MTGQKSNIPGGKTTRGVRAVLVVAVCLGFGLLPAFPAAAEDIRCDAFSGTCRDIDTGEYFDFGEVTIDPTTGDYTRTPGAGQGTGTPQSPAVPANSGRIVYDAEYGLYVDLDTGEYFNPAEYSFVLDPESGFFVIGPATDIDSDPATDDSGGEGDGLTCTAIPSICDEYPEFCTSCTPDITSNCSQADDIFEQISKHTADRFIEHQQWMLTMFLNDLLPAMQMMAEQLSATAMKQMLVIGTFLDAKHHLETQRLMQEMVVATHRDYIPSEAVCTVGSSIRSLRESETRGDLTALYLGQRSIDRQTLNANANAADNSLEDEDMAGRVDHFRRVYCDKNDNRGEFAAICGTAVPPLRRNKDIDFSRTLGMAETLDVDFSDTQLSVDEEDLLALGSFLYSHEVNPVVPLAVLQDKDNTRPNPSQSTYYDARSVIAMRSVAENSFHAIAAMKSKGRDAADTVKYLRATLVELGLSQQDANQLLVENPSYYAQMGVLTKNIFQRPEFFVGLYDKTVNVERKGVALQTISMMQKRDLFKSALRTEALISVLLELELRDAQSAVTDEIDRINE